MVGDPREGKIRLRVEPLSFAVSISEYIEVDPERATAGAAF